MVIRDNGKLRVGHLWYVHDLVLQAQKLSNGNQWKAQSVLATLVGCSARSVSTFTRLVQSCPSDFVRSCKAIIWMRELS